MQRILNFLIFKIYEIWPLLDPFLTSKNFLQLREFLGFGSACTGAGLIPQNIARLRTNQNGERDSGPLSRVIDNISAERVFVTTQLTRLKCMNYGSSTIRIESLTTFMIFIFVILAQNPMLTYIFDQKLFLTPNGECLCTIMKETPWWPKYRHQVHMHAYIMKMDCWSKGQVRETIRSWDFRRIGQRSSYISSVTHFYTNSL